jgi:hypothetical protein
VFTLRQVAAAPGWLQVIHGDNVTNRVKGRRRPASALEGRFALAAREQAREPDPAAVLAENLVHYPLRQLREAGVRLVKPFLKVVR